MNSEFQGSVEFATHPVEGAEVLLLSGQGKIVAMTRTTAQGTYALAPPAGFAGGWLMTRLHRPVIGARTQAVTASPAAVRFAIAASDAVTLSGEIQAPAGVKPDWLDVLLTPLSLQGVAAPAQGAVLAIDASMNIRAIYHRERITSSTFQQRVLPGSYELRVDRIVDAPLDSPLPMPNLSGRVVTLPDGTTVAPQHGGFTLDVTKDLHVTVTLDKLER